MSETEEYLDGVAKLRQPPFSTEAEQAVLGALLIDNDAFDRVADVLDHSDFFRFEHREIYATIARLVSATKPADVVTVHEALRQSGTLDKIGGGVEYLNGLSNAIPSARNVRRYADIVRDCSVRRKLIQELDNTTASLFAGSEEAKTADLAVGLCDKIDEVVQAHQSRDAVDSATAMAGVVDRITARAEGEVATIPTGIAPIDHQLTGGGLMSGQFIIIAGRPSMGKTTLALNIAENIAANRPVIVFEAEMTEPEVSDKRTSAHSRIPGQTIASGQLGDEHWRRLTETVDVLAKRTFLVDDTPGPTIAHIRLRAKAAKRRHGALGCIVVDHLSLLTGGPSGGENRNAEIGYYSRSLKRMAKELGCPVIALSQLNRSVEHRADKKPVLSDLRESGDIEQDADVVLFVFRPEYYWPDRRDFDGYAEALFRKQRNGPVGDVPLRFEKAVGLFDRWDGVRPSIRLETAAAGQRRADDGLSGF